MQLLQLRKYFAEPRRVGIVAHYAPLWRNQQTAIAFLKVVGAEYGFGLGPAHTVLVGRIEAVASNYFAKHFGRIVEVYSHKTGIVRMIDIKPGIIAVTGLARGRVAAAPECDKYIFTLEFIGVYSALNPVELYHRRLLANGCIRWLRAYSGRGHYQRQQQAAGKYCLFYSVWHFCMFFYK